MSFQFLKDLSFIASRSHFHVFHREGIQCRLISNQQRVLQFGIALVLVWLEK